MKRAFHTGFSVVMIAGLLVGFQNCGAPANGSSTQSSTAADAARIAAISKSANDLQAQLYTSAPQEMQSQIQDQLAQLQQIAGNSNSPDISSLAQQTQNQLKKILTQAQQQTPGTGGMSLPSLGGDGTFAQPASNGGVTANNSTVTTVSSPIKQTNSCNNQNSGSNSGGNAGQGNICQQGNQASIGIGGAVSNLMAAQQ